MITTVRREVHKERIENEPNMIKRTTIDYIPRFTIIDGKKFDNLNETFEGE